VENHWKITSVEPGHPDAAAVLRPYFTDIASRYYGRPATETEVDSAMAEDPSADLTPPTGAFLLGHRDGLVRGCVGLRVLTPEIAELRRMFVDPAARGEGGGEALLDAAEDVARTLGARSVRLDTRHDLVEARGLYAKHGYMEISAYSDGPYAEHWFEKHLA
jgi:GNAT superfamily N-acetyltransferase